MAEFSGASNYPEEFCRGSFLDFSLFQDLLEREIQFGEGFGIFTAIRRALWKNRPKREESS